MRFILRRVVHSLRTEGTGRSREAAAVGVGVFIGCLPFYGFHLLLCWGLGTLFGLNRLKVYLAAHISNPFAAPFLLLAEVQAGALLRGGAPRALTIETLRTLDPWVFGLDLLVGSIVVGGGASALAAALTYSVVVHRSHETAFATLVQKASDRYVGESLVAWEFARGKMHRDPVYETALCGGLLPSGGTIVDIGCGQGLMLALLVEAADAVRTAAWPDGRVPPPQFDRLVGVELRPRVAYLARVALQGRAEILEGNANGLPLQRCSAVVMFDVLHMMPSEQQEQLLASICKALIPGGVLLIREADASAGWRFTLVRIVNGLQALRVASWRQTFAFRSRQDWLTVLSRCGLEAEVCVQRGGGTLGNVLFRVTSARADTSCQVGGAGES